MAKHARGTSTVVDEPVSVSGRSAGVPAAGPRHAASIRRSPRRLVGVAVCVLLAGAAAVVVVIDRAPNRAASIDAGAARTSSRSSASVESRPDTTAARSTIDSVTVTVGGLPVALPQTSAGLTEPGILLIASPAADGSFDVVERAWLAQPVGALTLRPAPVAEAGHEFAAASATATGAQLSAGDHLSAVPVGTIDGASTLSVAQGDHFELRYRLAQVTVRSSPSAAGRALAAIGPLIAGAGDDLPVHFIVSGASVLGLNCPLLPFAEQSCGSRVATGPGFEHELPARLALATVQFNVPSA